MNILQALQIYRLQKRQEFKKVTTEVEGHWLTRIMPRGLYELGEHGATIYLRDYGRGIGEPKVICLAMKAEREGCQDMAWGFWKKAFELSTASKAKGSLITRSQNRKAKVVRPITILFLSSNPLDTARLRVDQEIRTIKETLRQAEFRDRFDIQQEWAVRPRDLQKYFLQYKPDIVHFSGHGTDTRELVFESDDGRRHYIPPEALGMLFQVHGAGVRCVLLNACYSLAQANVIARYVGCVVGMTQSIQDKSAISFATAFYQSLAYGKSVKNAFDSGRLEIELESPDLQEHYKPRLVTERVDPATVVFAVE
jgi:hypothetical protein